MIVFIRIIMNSLNTLELADVCTTGGTYITLTAVCTTDGAYTEVS